MNRKGDNRVMIKDLPERLQSVKKIEHVDEAVLGDAAMVSLLQQHGCRVDHTTVFFPTGTISQEILPRWGWTERYQLFLPSGLELQWKVSRMHNPSQSLLQVSRVLYEQEQERIAAKEALHRNYDRGTKR
ncbi:MAG: hypothetical protein JO183_08110 [Ktedonobacteraceae bacterium]|nr:hypothetical protein [Ktedonobacteraceae bacterium]